MVYLLFVFYKYGDSSDRHVLTTAFPTRRSSGLWREAVDELCRRRLRTGLTLLGLVFGVGAIVAMQAVGEGSRREALRLVESLGLHNLIAQARPQDDDARRETRERSLGLSVSDARAALADRKSTRLNSSH